jgi:O-antigen/teichoic acid export membrane protein
LLLLRILSLSSLFAGVTSVYATTLRVENRLRELTLIFGFVTAATLVGGYFIMPQAGMVGIGYVWLAVQGVVGIYAILAMRARYRVAK